MPIARIENALDKALNPKPVSPPASAASSPIGFTKPFTPEEKKKQADELARLLRLRGR